VGAATAPWRRNVGSQCGSVRAAVDRERRDRVPGSSVERDVGRDPSDEARELRGLAGAGGLWALAAGGGQPVAYAPPKAWLRGP
jgi:hypothetical protein